MPEKRDLERVTCELAELRAVEADASGAGPHLSGLACRFGVDLPIRQHMIEIITPGSITVGPRERDVKLLVGHQNGSALANTKHGTLKLRLDPDGLRFFANLGDTTLARDTWQSVHRGDLSGASIGFSIKGEAGEKWIENGKTVRRELLAIDLHEISITALPVDSMTYVEAHALEAGLRLLERRSAGDERIEHARNERTRALAWSRLAESRRLPKVDDHGRIVPACFKTER